MSVILTLISNAATSATRRAAFPRDEPIGEAGRQKAAALAGRLRRVDLALTSPALRARQTAEAMGLDAEVVAALGDLDLGVWSGRTLAEVAAAHPAEVAAWTADSSAAPHGGESVDDLLQRAGLWLQSLGSEETRIVAVTHAAILRAALILALRAPGSSFWRVDIAPLCVLRLRGGGGVWTLVSLETPQAKGA